MFEMFASTPEDMGPGDIGAHAARAEAMGFDGLQVPDAIHDGLLLSAMALAATRSLRVGTAVLVAFPRSPMKKQHRAALCSSLGVTGPPTEGVCAGDQGNLPQFPDRRAPEFRGRALPTD